MQKDVLSPEGTPRDAHWRVGRKLTISVKNLGTLLLSIVLALVVWLFAVNQEDPLIVQDLSERVPVTILGPDEGLVPLEDLSKETVKLRLRAPRSSWPDLDVNDFRASIDLAGLAPGEHNVEIKVTSVDPQVDIIDRQRQELRVTLERLESKEVPVQVDVMDGTAFGYDWMPPIYDPITVTVTGPASQVQQVIQARAEVLLRSAKSQVETMASVIPEDVERRVVSGIATTPGQVQAVVPVEPWPGRKEAAVRVKLQGQPARDYRLSSVKVEPATVVLQGESEALSQVPGYVETEPLDLQGAAGDVRARLKLVLPPGVSSFDGDWVVATAGITPIEDSRTLAQQPVLEQGLGPALVAERGLDTVDVIISGPAPLLRSLKQDDLFVVLELSGMTPGSYTVTPKVILPDGIKLEGVIPESMEVVIKSRNPVPQANGSLSSGATPPAQPATPTPLSPTPATTPTGTITATVPVSPTASAMMPDMLQSAGETIPRPTPGETGMPVP